MRRLTRIITSITLVACCQAGLAFAQNHPRAASTTVISFSFPVPSPQSVTINVGDSVQWNGASSFHPLEQVTGPSSDTPTSGGFTSTSSSFTHQFDIAGTYYYRCTNHGVASAGGLMRGTIIVQSSDSATPTPTATPTTCSAKPEASNLVSPVDAASVTTLKPTLDWSDSSCATTYRLTIRQNSKKGKLIVQKTLTKSKYKSKKLTAGSTYYWFVKACSDSGCTRSSTNSFVVSGS